MNVTRADLWGDAALKYKEKSTKGAQQSEESVRKPQEKEKKNVIQEPSSLANEITLQSPKSKHQLRGALGKQSLGAVAGQQMEAQGLRP